MGDRIMKESRGVARFQVKQGIAGGGEKWRRGCKCNGKPQRISKRVGYRDLAE